MRKVASGPRLESDVTLHFNGNQPEVTVFRTVAAASLVSLALAGCSAQSLAPSQRSGTDSQNAAPTRANLESASSPAKVTLQWNPTAIKLTDGGPYQPSMLTYTAGDTVVVNYDDSCNYRIDLDLHPGKVKNNLETDEYDFYAYTGKSGSPAFHCNVQALLKNANGRVIDYTNLFVTIIYPRKHAHGG